MKKIILFFIGLFFFTVNSFAAKITVTSGADPGVGTLREAIENANNGDTIVFASNVATVYFTAIINLDKNITIIGNEITNTVFQNAPIWLDYQGNRKRYFYILAGTEATFNYLTMKDNVGNCGGGAINNAGTLTLNYCIFSNNKAGDAAGAVRSTGNLIVKNCVFSNNIAPSGSGGAIYCLGPESIIINSLFVGNYTSIGNGGAVYMHNNAVAGYIYNCTFTGNTGATGSAICNWGTVTTLCNNIIWNNTGNTQDIYTQSGTTIAFNNLIGTSNINLSGNGNIIGVNPLFVGGGNYALQGTSPAIDKGNNTYIPAGITKDLAGNSRISNDIVDMGAYEFQHPKIFHTVSFSGEAVNIAPQTVEHGSHATQPATPERTGYNFGGWFTDNNTFLKPWNFASSIVTQDTTLYAKWVIKTYIVTFSGEEINIAPQIVNHGSKVTQPATPERTGYNFGGWFTDNNTFLKPWNFASSIVTQDTTLYAKWQIKTYTVTFAGEEINIAPQTVNHGGKVTQPATPERTGYNFGGWFTDNNTFLKPWNFASSIVTQDTTLYAKWVIKTYTVTFAGEEINIAQQTVIHGGKATQPDTPERTGYTFMGWFTDNGTFTNLWNFASNVITQDTTLYAKWQIKTYTVTFAGEEINITPQTVNHGGKATQPDTPERTGYDFIGWFSDNGTFTNLWNFANNVITQDTTLYAKWSTNAHFVSFAGEEINIAPQPVEHGSHATQPAIPERTGYNFGGWFIDNGTFESEWDFENDIVTQDTTLYAKWQIKTYTVTFAGEEINITPQSVNHGGKVTQPATPERMGYDFIGWFSDNGTFESEWDFASNIITQDTTLYAKWKEKNGVFTITDEDITIYPNPTTGELRIANYELRVKGVEIYDVSGRKVQFPPMSFMSPETLLDISHLAAGLYFVRIQTETGEVVRKVLKE